MILFWFQLDAMDVMIGPMHSRSVENGTLNVPSIVSIHRYADFESEQKLNDVYGTDNNSTHPLMGSVDPKPR